MANELEQNKNGPPSKASLTIQKKLVFASATAIVILLVIESGLRLLGIGAPPVVGSLRFGYDTGIPIFDSDGIEREGEVYQDVPLFQADTTLYWKPIEDTPFTGVHGLRLPAPESLTKPPNTLRVAVIGDSCSFLGEQLYPNRFADGIQDSATMEVVNASCPGYTSFQGVRRLEEVWRWDPDVVVVYFGWNDHWKSLNGLTDKELAERQRLSQASQSWLGMSRIFWCFYSMRMKWVPPAAIDDAPVRVPLEDYRENLRAIASAANQRDCRLMFITAPSAFMKDYLPPWAFSFFGQIYGMSKEQVESIPDVHEQYNEVVRDVSRQTPGALLVDVADRWSQDEMIDQHPTLFRADHIHLTETGHQQVAELMQAAWEAKQ